MDIQLKKWGNSLGLRIPHQLTKNFGWTENATLEIEETEDALIIRKKNKLRDPRTTSRYYSS